MIDKNNIIKCAERNKICVSGLISDNIDALKSADVINNSWDYYPESGIFRLVRSLHVTNDNPRWNTRNIKYSVGGLSMDICHGNYDPLSIEAIIEINPDGFSENTDDVKFIIDLYKLLVDKRQKLYNAWKKKTFDYIKEYFEESKDDIYKHPISYRNSCTITSPMFCVWSPYMKDRNNDIYKSIGYISNSDYEVLKEPYVPSLWSSDNSLSESIYHDGYILKINRSNAPDRTFHYEWPKVFATFIINQSEDPMFNTILSWFNTMRCSTTNKNVMNFIRDLSEYSEWVNDNGEISAIIPIIDECDINIIIRFAEKTLGDQFTFVPCERNVPMHSSVMKCIKVTLKQ